MASSSQVEATRAATHSEEFGLGQRSGRLLALSRALLNATQQDEAFAAVTNGLRDVLKVSHATPLTRH